MNTKNYKRFYIWELPVRFFHWINVMCLLALIATGLLIANPLAIMSNAEASHQFWFGYVREIHFISAYIMVAVMFMRLYWAFSGNRFARWQVFLRPFTASGFQKVLHIVKHDLLLQREPYDVNKIGIGHNNVAAASYLIMFLAAIVMIFTGFSLYAPTSTWFFPHIFFWFVNLFTSDELLVRNIHHVAMWFFVLFMIVHVYLVFYHDWLEGRGESSSMISGYKFERAERVEKVAMEQKKHK